MAKHTMICAGIDTGKRKLDIALDRSPEQQLRIDNTPEGYKVLLDWLRRRRVKRIGIEASGGYERGVMRALLAAGMPVRQVNPFKLRQFARTSGVLAKNDPLDARMIASSNGWPSCSASAANC